MKNLRIILFLFVFTLIGFVPAQAQRVESDSDVIGKWNLRIYMEDEHLENL